MIIKHILGNCLAAADGNTNFALTVQHDGLQTRPCCGNCSSASTRTAADDSKVVLSI